MNESIFVVEDEEALRTTLCDRLTREGFVVETSADGEDAYEKAIGNGPSTSSFWMSCCLCAADWMCAATFARQAW